MVPLASPLPSLACHRLSTKVFKKAQVSFQNASSFMTSLVLSSTWTQETGCCSILQMRN